MSLACQHGIQTSKLPLSSWVCANGLSLLFRCSGEIHSFIIEPFVPHDQEYYLSIQSQRLGNVISFSEAGGVEIEENWEKVKTVTLNTMQELTEGKLAPLLGGLTHELRKKLEKFIQSVYGVSHFLLDAHWEASLTSSVNNPPWCKG